MSSQIHLYFIKRDVRRAALKSWLSSIAKYLAIPAIILAGCEDSGPPGDDPCNLPNPALSATRRSVVIVPGSYATVTVVGVPPISITTPPDPGIAFVTILDSSKSLVTLVISAPTTATIGDQSEVVVGDGCMNTMGITIRIVTVPVISYSHDIQPIWDVNCQSRGCHPGGGAPFSLDRFVSWSNLWFVPVANTNCGAIYRVVGGENGSPGNPDSSLVYLLVSGQTSCPRMPFSTVAGDTLSKADQDKIRVWILGGAQNN